MRALIVVLTAVEPNDAAADEVRERWLLEHAGAASEPHGRGVDIRGALFAHPVFRRGGSRKGRLVGGGR